MHNHGPTYCSLPISISLVLTCPLFHVTICNARRHFSFESEHFATWRGAWEFLRRNTKAKELIFACSKTSADIMSSNTNGEQLMLDKESFFLLGELNNKMNYSTTYFKFNISNY